jgi:hypothetical protein
MVERSESLGHYEMLWDCEYCGTTGLLGNSQRHCANCGAAQNPDKRYFPKEGEEKKVDGHRFEGADRVCPACSNPMGATALNCTKCGSPLEGAQTVKGVAAPAKPVETKRTPWLKILLVVGAIALVIILIWYFFIRTKEQTMTVSGHTWSRVIGVDEFGEQRESEWRDRMPSDARFPTCIRKERSTRQVDTGTEDCRVEKKDNKDGTFEQVKKCKKVYRSEGVDDDWCSYTILRWREVAQVKANGSGLDPSWPTQGLPPVTAASAVGARRQGKRSETLTLQFGAQSCDVSDGVWRKYANGQKVKLEVRARSGDIVCSSL